MISIVSGTVGRLSLLQRMIKSVRNSVKGLEYELVIVDNNSDDGSKEWLQAQDDVVYLNVGEPRGATYSFQAGYKAAKGEYIVHLNDDIAVEGDTIYRAYQYLEAHPETGQVAFHHKYQNRQGVNKSQPIIQRMFGGYVYAQTGMIRSWLAKACGYVGLETEGYTHYAWDNYLSARVWELGFRVDAPSGCCVIDWEHVDAIRKRFSDQMRADGGGRHPDTVAFMRNWKGRLPPTNRWVPSVSPAARVLYKASKGNLRTLRYKSMMNPKHTNERTALIEVFGEYGPAKQYNQTAAAAILGMKKFQEEAVKVAANYQPDLIMLQAQRPNNVLPKTVAEIRKAVPQAYIFNWDADTHYPMEPFHYQVAAACDMQFVISPTMFPDYYAHGVHNIGWWSIGVENDYLDAVRGTPSANGPDVTFLGSVYGIGKFPEAETRRDAVLALTKDQDIKLRLHGGGWHKYGITGVTHTGEKHAQNAYIYTRSKMGLSISQTAEMWGYTSDRAYNIMATGCPILCQAFVGMEAVGFVDGETCIAWQTIPEMLEKTKYYLEHDDEREAIGAAGKELIVRRHTWQSRVEDLFAMLLP